jgi:DNA-binding MarR family transcriptional regulator
MNPKPIDDDPSYPAGGSVTAVDAGPKVPISLSAPPAVPRDSYELRILQSLRRIIRAIEIHSHKLSQNHRITGPQLGCLLALREQGPFPLGRLARALFLSPSTMVGIVDRLEEKGLVQRTRNTPDRRQVNIQLTEAGRNLAEAAPSPLQETLAEGLKRLPELEQVSITLALERVVELMGAEAISAAPVLETGPLPPPTPDKTAADYSPPP